MGGVRVKIVNFTVRVRVMMKFTVRVRVLKNLWIRLGFLIMIPSMVRVYLS